jgi:hypothetical protein
MAESSLFSFIYVQFGKALIMSIHSAGQLRFGTVYRAGKQEPSSKLLDEVRELSKTKKAPKKFSDIQAGKIQWFIANDTDIGSFGVSEHIETHEPERSENAQGIINGLVAKAQELPFGIRSEYRISYDA